MKPERIAVIPAYPGEQAAVIWSKKGDLVIVPVVAWRIMHQPETDDGPATYIAEPITAHFSVDEIDYSYAIRLADGRWHDPIYEETFGTAAEFQRWVLGKQG